LFLLHNWYSYNKNLTVYYIELQYKPTNGTVHKIQLIVTKEFKHISFL
jgi:hypothetical protein